MSSKEANSHPGQNLRKDYSDLNLTSSSNRKTNSSDLTFTSSDSNDQAVPAQAQRESTFQWPSEPLNHGLPSLPQDTQKGVEEANRDISDRIASADKAANSQPDLNDSFPGLDQPRHSASRTATLDTIEDEARQAASPANLASLPESSSSTFLPMLSPQPQSMHRSSSNGTNKSAGSDKIDANAAAAQYTSFLPDLFRHAASMPLNLLRSLIPDNAVAAANDEGLSASTLQVPVASFNALFEACKSFEWLATQAANIEAADKGSASRRTSTGQQLSEEGSDFAYFDYLQLIQKVADVVSGLAASKGIDLVLDLEPKLEGQPADNQRHYKLGTCTVWADRVALAFLFINCISRLLNNAPVQSTVVLTTVLTEKEENVVRPDSNSEMRLMVLSVGLRLILPPTVAHAPDVTSDSASLLLDAFGASFTTAQSTAKIAGTSDRVVIDQSISVPVGRLPEPEQPTSQQQQQEQSGDPKHKIGPEQDELVEFASSLRGKKVALYSTSQSIFARQLSRFLTDLGCDIAPVFSDSVDESSFDGDDQVFGKQAHTAVALTSGRPALVSYTSDIDKRIHPDKSAEASQDEGGSQTPKTVDTAVLDPVTGVPVTFDNSMHQTSTPSSTPGLPKSDNPQGEPPAATQIDSNGRRVVPFSFVIIDDDIITLQKELLRIRSAVPLLKSALVSKSSASSPSAVRPTLDHRTRSTPQVNRFMASQPDASHPQSFGSLGSALMNAENGASDENGKTVEKAQGIENMDESVSQTIIFFTSMKSYRLVRDTVQPIIDSASFRGVSSPPEIMVLPKPAGAKRILTALHSAEHKPVVHLPFLPIATSPLSPLIAHTKTWWTPGAAQDQEENIMTLTRRQTVSTESDFDTTPSTPWTPIDAAKSPDAVPTPAIPLTSENLPLAGQTSAPAPGASVRTDQTQITARHVPTPGAPVPASAPTTKSAPRSTAPGQPARTALVSAAAGNVDGSSTQMSTNAGSAASSSVSPHSSAHQSRSHTVSSPMPADALEYFSDAAAKMGGSAASGMVIQSPDGRPAGIFFQPKSSQSSTAPGSKPTLSRGVSASSLRRSSTSEQGDRAGAGSNGNSASSESANRERRLTNRSNASSGGASTRGGDNSQARSGTLPTVSEQATSSGSTEKAAANPNGGRFPSGSMFAPQVGISSVLNSSRPPMTTPLGPVNPSPPPSQEASEGGKDEQPSIAAEKGNGKQPEPQQGAGTNSAAETDKAAAPEGSSSSTNAGNASGSSTRKPPSKPAVATGSKSVTPSPSSNTAADRLKARQSGPISSPSDPTKTQKPSAVPQSGFMMGMGFTSSARRGRGPKKAPVREAVLPPIKVLIVEDNPINQALLSRFMGKKKIKHDVATNGREAVDKWKTGGYHLILMDIQLPVMDGIEATKEIRKLERNANIGILPNTPPATEERKELGGGSRTVTSKGLVKQVEKASGGPHGGGGGALVNGIGSSNTIPSTRSGGGGINPFRASVIIVALTASVLSSDRVEALAAGCNDFLNKPVSLPWLNQKILEWGSMMYLMYSGLSSDDIHRSTEVGGGGGRGDRAQLHLGFGYGPAEKAKALANNLHLGDTLALKKKKKREEEEARKSQQQGSKKEEGGGGQK